MSASSDSFRHATAFAHLVVDELPIDSVGELRVRDAVGVSPVDFDTRMLARHAIRLSPPTALDMGTGTGFIAIALTRSGIRCDATDVSPAAIRQARCNADRAGCAPNVFASNLFERVQSSYALILFNPPFGHARSTFAVGWVELLKSLLPKENPIVRTIAYAIVRRSRGRLICRFLDQAPDHLDPGGRILLLLHVRELCLLAAWKCEVLEARSVFRLVSLTKPEDDVA